VLPLSPSQQSCAGDPIWKPGGFSRVLRVQRYCFFLTCANISGEKVAYFIFLSYLCNDFRKMAGDDQDETAATKGGTHDPQRGRRSEELPIKSTDNGQNILREQRGSHRQGMEARGTIAPARGGSR